MAIQNLQSPSNKQLNVQSIHEFKSWLEYTIKVQTHHAYYLRIVWHGNYLQ